MTASCFRFVVAACAAAGSLAVFGETYYGDFHDKKNSYAYDWYTPANWKVKDAGGKLVTATTIPQEGDDVVITNGCGQMSANDGTTRTTAYLNSMTYFYAPSSLHQGHIGFLANHPGLKVHDKIGVGTWAGLAVKGSGDFVVDIGSGGSYNNQKGVARSTDTDQITLVKKGAGSFNPVSEGNTEYTPVRTLLMGGMFVRNNAKIGNGHELVFGSNDSNLRFKMQVPSSCNNYADPVFTDGALIESNEVQNTAHGFSSGSTTRGFYVRFAGTPKLAEQRFTGTLYDMAGIAFCPGVKQADGSDYLFTIAKAVNPYGQGCLAVTNGTLRLAEGATFKGLPNLNVGATGTFRIESGSGEKALAFALDVAAGGKLDLGEGVTLSANAVTIGGETLTNGTYTAGNCAAIAGAGTLSVIPYASVDTIVLDVAAETDVTSALAAYNAASGESVSIATLNGGVDKERPLVKRGAGLLKMDKPLSGYIAPVYVEEGVLRTEVRYSLGKESNANAPVYVRAGATVTTLTTNTVMNYGRTFHIAGNGNSTYGAALHCYGNGVAGNWGNSGCLGANVILDADATVHCESWMFVGYSRLELNGHKLNFTLSSGKTEDRPGHLPSTLAGPGEIVISGGQWRFQSTINFEGSGKITLGPYGGFRLTGQPTTFSGTYKNWTIQAEAPSPQLYCDYNIMPRDAKQNILDIPLVLNAMIALWNQSDRDRNFLLVKTPVSGTGGFSTAGTRTSFLHLLDPNQTYTGGLYFNRGVIWAYPNGAIPAVEGAGDVVLSPSGAALKSKTSAPFTNTFNGVAFMCPDTYALPGLVSQGASPARVQNGRGRWKTVTQNGAGGLEYYSSLGADRLDVREGDVRLGRGMMAGLWEGTNLYSKAADAQTAYGTAVCFTNLAVRGPTSAIQEKGHNYTGWQAKELITYKGYVWNRGSETVTWTFASALSNASVCVKVDGSEVFSGANQILHGNVTLTPGAHAFEYRACSGDKAAAPITNLSWRAYHGFAIDRQGRNSGDSNDYEMGVDTGDGALFTRTADPTADLPEFGLITLAAGTKLDLNGNAFTAERIGGGGTVTNTATDASADARLVLKGLHVDAAKDETLAIGVPATLDASFAVTVTNVATRLRKSHTALVLKEPLETVPTAIPVTAEPADGSFWCAEFMADRKTLTVRKAGLAIYLR